MALNVSANLSQSREDTFNINLIYSMRELAQRWDRDRKLAVCPEFDTHFTTDLSATGGEFSGIVNFIVTKNLNSTGPTWTLTHFVGPGNLASLSRVNNDKLSFGFATGKYVGTPFKSHGICRTNFSRANRVLEQVLLNDLGTQLKAIRNQTK